MSTYVLMRILESTPRRYDFGIRLLTFGAVGRAYDRLAGHITRGQRVLDIGFGTGALAIRAVLQRARVTAIDVDPRMLELAAQRAREAHVEDGIELREEGVPELDREPGERYDAVTCGLCLLELSEDEVAYALDRLVRLLKPGGLFLVLDRDSTFAGKAVETVRALDVKPRRTAYRSPWQNRVAERWIGSGRRELLDRVIVLHEGHLRRLLREYVDYYSGDRCHLALEKDSLEIRSVQQRPSHRARVVSLLRVGGLHQRYVWRTAA